MRRGTKIAAIVALIAAFFGLSWSLHSSTKKTEKKMAEERKRALLVALLASEMQKSQTMSTSPPSQVSGIGPMIFAHPSVVERSNAYKVLPDLPKDALCNTRGDPATYLQCCQVKRQSGVLDATCPMYTTGKTITN